MSLHYQKTMFFQNILLNFVLVCKLCSYKTAVYLYPPKQNSPYRKLVLPTTILHLAKKYKKRAMYVNWQSRRETKNCMPSKNVKESTKSCVIRKAQIKVKNKSEIIFHVHWVGPILKAIKYQELDMTWDYVTRVISFTNNLND